MKKSNNQRNLTKGSLKNEKIPQDFMKKKLLDTKAHIYYKLKQTYQWYELIILKKFTFNPSWL